MNLSSGQLGLRAEKLAYRYLRQHGLAPVTKNFRTRRGEIDLVMLHDACLTFIEVRYRASNHFARAMFTVDARKQRKIIETASIFLTKHQKYRNHVCRFDVVGVDSVCGGEVSINWLQDAFRATA